MNSKIKRLYFDLETSANVVYSWRIGHDVMISHDNIIEERKIICIGYKWEGDKDVRILSWDENQCDKKMLTEFIEIMNLADEVVAHNGDKFDIKWLRTRCIFHRLPMIPDYQSLDTLKAARGKFLFNSNKLDYIAQFLGIGKKSETGGFGLWKEVMQGDEAALKKMCNYCITPDHKLLKSDMRWYEARDIKVGDSVLGFDENGKRRRFRDAIVEKISYDNQEVFEVRLSSGKIFKVTGDHLWLVRSGNTYKWVKTTDMYPFNKKAKTMSRVSKVVDVWEEDMTRDAGWLAGMFDGEGCLSFRGNRGSITALSIAQNPGIILDKIESILGRFTKHAKRQTVKNAKCKTLHIYGTKMEKLNLLGRLRPERLLKKIDFDKLGAFESRGGDEYIEDIKSIGNQEIIQIQTSTGTFICDGYAHHNCKQDVLLLEGVYQALSDYLAPTMHVGVLNGGYKHSCPHCGSDKNRRNKTSTTSIGSMRYQMQCTDCERYWTISQKEYDTAENKEIKDM
jgi:DNA polymerase III epsilon subunit-like protein